ncbi:hypothetical protein HHK36_028957 [Tetracentron sinense]|uniref:Tripeptidyl-peptidase 2 n=1 Tax=Tetracentron sinense TaxID=13715 RepID=A0A834YE10_TETSI|nr:hypothetical protein HHK36_028957 [Tetracentron sinense]
MLPTLFKAARFDGLQLFYQRNLPLLQDSHKQKLRRGKRRGSEIRAMPFSSSAASSEENGALRSFKLNESTFLASLMPKKEIGADRFIEAHPHYDGRGVVIAIFDSGVDPAAAGLQVTSDGKPKIIDVLDCTGSGDIDTSTVVKADEDGCISGASGALLVVNPSWKNPSGEWHVGYKLIFELFTDTLTSRLKKERKKNWDEKNQEAITEAVKRLDEFDQKHLKVEDINLKRNREDLQSRIDFLRKQAESYDDRGPVIDAVVWNDGDVWRVALDTQSLEDDPKSGKLADFIPLTNYRIERKFGIFSKLDACTFITNVYDEGNILSIVTDSSPHGTHVAGIATAFHPKEPLLNGVAPGAQLISCKIGDSRLGSMETGTGLTRALVAAVEHNCDLINMSYGEPTLLPDYGRFVDLVNEVVNEHRIIFISSAGNNGPALSTVGAPGGTTSSIIGVGAYVSPAMAAGAHCVVEPPFEGLEYTWSSRGPTVDGDLGVCVSAPGGAVAPVPTWTLQRRMLMNGTSMASPSACGGVALLISAMKAEDIPVSPYSVRKALENTTVPVGGLPVDKLSTGEGLMQVDKLKEVGDSGEVRTFRPGEVEANSNFLWMRAREEAGSLGQGVVSPEMPGGGSQEEPGVETAITWAKKVGGVPKSQEGCRGEAVLVVRAGVQQVGCTRLSERAPGCSMKMVSGVGGRGRSLKKNQKRNWRRRRLRWERKLCLGGRESADSADAPFLSKVSSGVVYDGGVASGLDLVVTPANGPLYSGGGRLGSAMAGLVGSNEVDGSGLGFGPMELVGESQEVLEGLECIFDGASVGIEPLACFVEAQAAQVAREGLEPRRMDLGIRVEGKGRGEESCFSVEEFELIRRNLLILEEGSGFVTPYPGERKVREGGWRSVSQSKEKEAGTGSEKESDQYASKNKGVLEAKGPSPRDECSGEKGDALGSLFTQTLINQSLAGQVVAASRVVPMILDFSSSEGTVASPDYKALSGTRCERHVFSSSAFSGVQDIGNTKALVQSTELEGSNRARRLGGQNQGNKKILLPQMC